MTGWEQFIIALHAKGPFPTYASPIWIVSLVLLIGLTVGMVFLNWKVINKQKPETQSKIYKYILLGVWITIMILEVFKQIASLYSVVDDKVTFDYAWGNFPLQLCSLLIYVLPIIVFMKDCVVRKRFELFAAIFFLIGGGFGFFCPGWDRIIWLNYQTMYYHGMMIVVGIFIGIRNRDQFNIINFWQSSLIYIGFFSIGMFLNWLIPFCVKGAEVNLFFVSWLYEPMPGPLKPLWHNLPYPLYLTLFLIGMAAIAFVLFILLSLIYNRKIVFVPKQETKKVTKKAKK